ncbi:50S ribosomal protein L10 [Halobacteriovorax marinus]|uniref:Large ribosomal subunit protein uL10 n=1 Tax=Halobacteriovorax marinus TaxID=97084 RepID=A0A1Y5F2X4_9BACT|nr:50S ribosomal protein L10 [Halobacteriovorax marinus]
MLTREEKGAIVDSLKSDIEKAQGIFLTNVIGLTSNDGVALRKDIRDANGKLVVTRNTLFARAAKGTEAEEMLSDLKGPQAVAFAFEDAPGVAKALKEAGKTHELVELRGGILDGKVLSLEDVMALADLPSRDEMLGTLLATFNAPISALARVLFAVQESKDAGEEAAPVEAAATEEAPATTEE